MSVPATWHEYRRRLHMLSVDGGRLAYVDEGRRDGTPILLLHGMPTSSWVYRKVVPDLVAGGLRVIVPDLLGFGASDKPQDLAQYAPDKQALRVLALMSSLGLREWTHVCHDLGGIWTWELIDREPQSIKRLAILNTTAYRDGWNPPDIVRVLAGPLGPFMFGLMASGITGPRMVGSFVRQYSAHPRAITGAVVEGYWRPLHEGAVRPFRQMVTAFGVMLSALERYTAALRRLRSPGMIIWGGRDPVLDSAKIPAQFARDLRIPQDRIHVLENANHFLQEDQPGEIARLLLGFVQS